MTTTNIAIEDVTKLGQYSYICGVGRGAIVGQAVVKQAHGAYVMETCSENRGGRRMGIRQRQQATDLMLEAKGNMARALYAAGWSSEQVEDRVSRKTIILWHPPVK